LDDDAKLTSILQVKKTIDKIVIGNANKVSGIGISGNKIALYGVSKSPPTISKIGDYETVYRATGKFISYALRDEYRKEDIEISPENPKFPDRIRPICGGMGISNIDVGGIGTIASVVTDSAGRVYILSNNHVLGGNSAPVGSTVTQPGTLDGGVAETDTIATLTKFVTYNEAGENIVDAAIAEIVPGTEFYQSSVINDNSSIDMISDIRSAKVGDRIYKHGRTSGETTGVIIDTDFSTTMPYPDGKNLYFQDQLLIDLDSYNGDSGSLIFDKDGYAVGLLIGGSLMENGERFAVANKIRNVSALLGIGF
jgi:hypothetical protein